MPMWQPAGLVIGAALGIVLGILLAAASIIVFPAKATPTLPQTPAVPAGEMQVDPTAEAEAIATPAAPAEQTAAAVATPTDLPKRLTILVMGVDNRPDEAVGRTDSIMLVTVNTQTGASGLVSFARDLLVPIPSLKAPAKINTAYLYGETGKYPGGGPALLQQTLTNLIGYKIDYYVRINFDGFRSIIDQIGGIDVDVAQPINDPQYPDENYGYDPLYIPAGHIHMDGNLALKYARTRHTDSDYGRARRQQQVVLAVKNKLMQPGNMAALLPKLPVLAVTMARTVQTNMPIDKAIEIARYFTQGSLHNPASVVIDDTVGTDSTDPTWGFVLIPDMPRVKAAAAVAFADQPAAQLAAISRATALPGKMVRGAAAQATATAQAVATATAGAFGARVALLNGTSEKGLADRLAIDLNGDGYQVVGVGNADSEKYADSWLITYGNAEPAAKQGLVQRFGIAPDHIRAEPAGAGGADLVVILGANVAESSQNTASVQN